MRSASPIILPEMPNSQSSWIAQGDGAGLGAFRDAAALRAALSTHPSTQRFRFLEAGRRKSLVYRSPGGEDPRYPRPQLHVTYLLKEARAVGLKPKSAACERAVLFMLGAGLGPGRSQDDRDSIRRRGVVYW